MYSDLLFFFFFVIVVVTDHRRLPKWTSAHFSAGHVSTHIVGTGCGGENRKGR